VNWTGGVGFLEYAGKNLTAAPLPTWQYRSAESHSGGKPGRSGQRCKCVPTANGQPKSRLDDELRPARWTSSETELENRPPAAVRIRTQNTWKREGDEALRIAALSFQNDLGAKQ